MKIELEIKDSKVDFFLELIKSFSFVKVLGSDSAKIEKNIAQSVKELNLYNKGKLETTPIEDLLNEL